MKPSSSKNEDRLDLWYTACEATAVLFGALLVAGAGGVYHCYEYAQCKASGHCILATRLRPLAVGCAFVNSVSMEADVLYNGTVGMLYSSTRSVCSPGERLYLNQDEGVECAPKRAWPNALNTEIMDLNRGSYHERACGAWISAGNYVFNPDGNSLTSIMRPQYWSFYDANAANEAVRHAEANIYSSARLSASVMGKFYAACQTTVLGGNAAIRASAILAYRYLTEGMPTPDTKQASLRAIGWLASHYCEGPVLIASHLMGSGWEVKSYRGSAFSQYELAQALFAMGEPASVQSDAEEAVQFINANAHANATVAEFVDVFQGATGAFLPRAPLLDSTPELSGFVKLQATSSQAMVSAFLRGAAAHCALSLDASLSGSGLGSVSDLSAVKKGLKRMKEARPPASSLNRLATLPNHSPMQEIEEEEITNASVVTWVQITAQPQGDPTADCTALTRFVFPDRIEQERFKIMVPDALYEQLHNITELIRLAVVDVVRDPPFNNTLLDPEAVVTSTLNTKVRIPGAPRNSWAGTMADLHDADLGSNDGILLMSVKQARAIFLDRMNRLVLDRAHTCDGPPVKDALTTNAYIYPFMQCTFILLGMLRMPFADERYDVTSLASRLGWIIGHELSHNTLVTYWDYGQLGNVLRHYRSNVLREAIADVVSALAVIRAGLANASEICNHVSQIWCARTPFGYATSPEDTHPAPNERGDKLCATLADFGYVINASVLS
tara:strand:+ start:15561 stop:17741 length:2181 start_codon:yes stop_codon:yes gene_type:complete